MTIAAYMRVSTDEQRQRQTIAMQREQLERHILKHDLTVGEWYADDGVTGTINIDQRPEGRRLIADARAGRVDRLLVYKLDRLGRDALVTLSAIDALDQCGTEIVSITQNLDLKTPHGRFMAVIDCGVSGYERDTLVERSMDGSQRVARQGGWLGGKPPFGYRLSGAGSAARLVPSEVLIPGLALSEADVVREMYRLVAEERRSCQYVAEWLNRLGVPTVYRREGIDVNWRGEKPSGRWSLARVRNVLANTTYKGVQTYGKRSKDKAAEIIEREVPPLVTGETWQRARQQLINNRTYATRNAVQEYLLRGLIKCSCGYSYVGQTQHNRSGSYLYYNCSGNNYRRDKVRCAPIKGKQLEADIWAEIVAWSDNPQSFADKARAQIAADRDDAATIHAELVAVQRQIGNFKGERDSVLALFRKGRISEADLDRQFDAIAAEERGLEEKADALRARAHAAEEEIAQLAAFDMVWRNLTRLIDDADTFEKRRHVLEGCISSIVARTIDGEARTSVVYQFDRLGDEVVTRAARRAYSNPLTITIDYPAVVPVVV